MDELSTSEVLFDAPKLFWRTRNTMDVMLVEHFADKVVEVIAYEPSFDQEAPRLYVCNDVLLSILDASTVERRIGERKEQLLRRHITPDDEAVRVEILKAVKVEFLLARMVIDEFNVDEKKVTISLQVTHLDSDTQAKAKSLLCKGKPAGVMRHRTKHNKQLTEGAVDAVLEILAAEHATIDRLCEVAMGRTAAAQDCVLSAGELWRVPLMYSKKLRGRRLSSGDEETWRALAHRLIHGLPNGTDALTAIGQALRDPMKTMSQQADGDEVVSGLAVSPCATPAASTPRRMRASIANPTAASQSKTNAPIASKETNKVVLPRGRTVPRVVPTSPVCSVKAPAQPKSTVVKVKKAFFPPDEDVTADGDAAMSMSPPPSSRQPFSKEASDTAIPAATSRVIALQPPSSTNSVSNAMNGIGNMLRKIPSSLGFLAAGEATQNELNNKKQPRLSLTGSFLQSFLPGSLRSSFQASKPHATQGAMHEPKAPVVLHPPSPGAEISVAIQEESVSTSAEVWFHGPKLFWKTKNTCDVAIVHHSDSEGADGNGVVEVIVYEPSLDKEAPRLYVSDATLSARLDQSEIAAKLVQEREAMIRRHETPDTAQLLQKIVRQMKIDFLCNRLLITEFDTATKGFKVGLQCTFRDTEGGMAGTTKLLLDEKPKGLHRYHTFQRAGVLGGLPALRSVVTSLFTLLNEDHRALQADVDRAEGLQFKSRATLSSGEKWRIPLIYRRVARGKPLSDRDSAVWHALSDSIKLNAATEAQQEGVQGDMGNGEKVDGHDEGDDLAIGIANARVKPVPRPRPALHIPKFVAVTGISVATSPTVSLATAGTTTTTTSSQLQIMTTNPTSPNSSRPSSRPSSRSVSRSNSLRRIPTSGVVAGGNVISAASAPLKKVISPHVHTPSNKRIGAAATTPKRRSLDCTTSSVSFDVSPQTHSADSSALPELEGKGRTPLVPLSRVGSIDDEITVAYCGNMAGGVSDKSISSKEEAWAVPAAPRSSPEIGIRKEESPAFSNIASPYPSRRGSITFDLLQAALAKLTLPFTTNQKVKVYSAPPEEEAQ